MENNQSKTAKHYREIISFIDKGNIEMAKKILDSKQQVPFRKYFYNRIKEEQMSNYIKENYLEPGIYALELQEYELAYDYFEAGKYLEENPLFDFYLGKIFFMCSLFETASLYLNNYRQIGSKKLDQCYLYLYEISETLEYKTSKKYLNKYNNIKTFLENKFQIKDYSKKKKKKKKKVINKNIPKEDKKITFEQLPLKEKLEVIKELLLRKQEKEANKLLNSLKPTDKKEKQLLEQLKNNKKLYLNKR